MLKDILSLLFVSFLLFFSFSFRFLLLLFCVCSNQKTGQWRCRRPGTAAWASRRPPARRQTAPAAPQRTMSAPLRAARIWPLRAAVRAQLARARIRPGSFLNQWSWRNQHVGGAQRLPRGRGRGCRRCWGTGGPGGSARWVERASLGPEFRPLACSYQ